MASKYHFPMLEETIPGEKESRDGNRASTRSTWNILLGRKPETIRRKTGTCQEFTEVLGSHWPNQETFEHQNKNNKGPIHSDTNKPIESLMRLGIVTAPHKISLMRVGEITPFWNHLAAPPQSNGPDEQVELPPSASWPYATRKPPHLSWDLPAKDTWPECTQREKDKPPVGDSLQNDRFSFAKVWRWCYEGKTKESLQIQRDKKKRHENEMWHVILDRIFLFYQESVRSLSGVQGFQDSNAPVIISWFSLLLCGDAGGCPGLQEMCTPALGWWHIMSATDPQMVRKTPRMFTPRHQVGAEPGTVSLQMVNSSVMF